MQLLDRDTAAGSVGRWLADKMPFAKDLKVTAFAAPLAGNSAETTLFEIQYSQAGELRTEGLVLRLQYEGVDLFLNSDFGFQCDVLQAMGRQSGPPTPALIGLERDRSVLGCPFYVMRRIEGRVVQQFPNYNQQGWLAELPLAQRRRAWDAAIRALAQIHQIDWRADFAFMDDPRRGAPGLDQYLHYVEEWFHWAAAGREQPIADAALDYLKRNKPKNPPVELIWGDATPANILFAPDNSVAGIIDWEMAALGPGEIDLAWWLFFDDLFSDGWGVPRLEGLPSRDEIIAVYEAARGRKAENLEYYDILAMVRLGIVSLRHFDRTVSFGQVDPNSKAYLNNPIMAKIARRLGLPEPEVTDEFAAMQPDVLAG